MPQLLSRTGIHGIHHAPWRNAVQDAVENQRSSLLTVLRIARCCRNIHVPADAKPAHIRGIDLLQRAVPLFRPVDVVADPFFTRFARVAQSGFVHTPGLLRNRAPNDNEAEDQQGKEPDCS